MKKILSLLFITALIISALVLVSCEDEFVEVVVPHEHTFTKEIVNPNCQKHIAGYTNYVCDCGYSYQEDFVEAHDFVTTVIYATCHDTGYTVHECKVCNYTKRDTFTAKNPDNHVYYNADGTLNALETVDSTCVDYGYTLCECIYCGNQKYMEIKSEIVAHTWSDWTVTIVANCVNEGLMTRQCTVCGELEQKMTPKTDDHVYGEWTVIINDDHINDFYEERACTMCRHKEVGPNNEEGVLAFELVVDADGSKHYAVIGYAEGKTSSTVVIPEYLYENGEKIYVTEIKAQAFMYNTNLVNIYIPSSITKIGAFAFSGCTTLVQINYLGTQVEWEAIEKSSSWNYKSGDFKVVTK